QCRNRGVGLYRLLFLSSSSRSRPRWEKGNFAKKRPLPPLLLPHCEGLDRDGFDLRSVAQVSTQVRQLGNPWQLLRGRAVFGHQWVEHLPVPAPHCARFGWEFAPCHLFAWLPVLIGR